MLRSAVPLRSAELVIDLILIEQVSRVDEKQAGGLMGRTRKVQNTACSSPVDGAQVEYSRSEDFMLPVT